MSLEKVFQQVADGSRPSGTLMSLAQGALSLIAPIYTGGAVANRLLYTTGLKAIGRLPVPVVSVGNISLGGTGKTPFTLWLVEWLRAQGKRPGIVSRGYGRADEDRLVLVHDGKKLRADAATGGDEPVLMARSLADVPVAVCADRHRAGMALVRRFACDIIVLDDGFQHHRLQRNGDIVLVDATRPLSGLKMFPRGTLREPTGALSRAHLVVLTRWRQATNPKRALHEVQTAAAGVPVVRTHMAVKDVYRVDGGVSIQPEELRGARVIVLCGVGNPASVRKTVEELGAKVVRLRQFADHETIPRNFLVNCDSLRRKIGADYIIMTEKDAVKLSEDGRLFPEVLALRIKVEFVTRREEEVATRIIGARLRSDGLKGLLT